MYRTCPGTMNGNVPPAAGGGTGAAGGADAAGRRPFALKAATSGFSAPEVGICGVLLTGIWGRVGTCGGGVDCCRAAVALMSSASVPGFKSC